jgi:hypothetical protein
VRDLVPPAERLGGYVDIVKKGYIGFWAHARGVLTGALANEHADDRE